MLNEIYDKIKGFAIPIIILLALGGSIYGISELTSLTTTISIQNFVTIEAPPELGVYWDITGMDDVTSISWGEMDPGEEASVNIYIRNEGLAPFIGYLDTENWYPNIAQGYISVSWDFGEYPVKEGRVRKTTLTLRVDEDIVNSSEKITSFNFNILIIGTEI